MEKSSSEIARSPQPQPHPGYARCLSRRMVFSYLYEKKMPNMKIENLKKSQKNYKKITNHPRCNPSTRQGPYGT